MKIRIIEDHAPIAEMLAESMHYYDPTLEVETVTRNFETLLDAEAWEGFGGALIDLRLSSTVTGEAICAFLRDTFGDRIRRVAYSASSEQILGSLGSLVHRAYGKATPTPVLVDGLRGGGDDESC